MGQSAMVTVLFNDIVGSTDLLSRLGEAAFDELRRQHVADMREVIVRHAGTEVKNLGDGLMVVFPTVTAGVAAAIEMPEAAGRVIAAGVPLRIRVGLAVGDATFDDGDWFGVPVVEAARLCSAAGAGEVYTTAVVRALAGSAAAPVARFESLGSRTLKGFDDPIEVVLATPVAVYERSYFAQVDIHTAEMAGRMAEALDYWERREGIQQVRAEMRRRLAAAPGQVIADIGCGTGTELAAVAAAVGPGGRAIGIDPSAPILDVARTRLAGLDGVELVEASGFDTGLESASCDGVRIERVVQHTGRVVELLTEAHRIVRPGGRVVIADTDWGSLMLHPGDRDFVRGMKARWDDGPMAEPWAGRTLAGGLLDAGFVDVHSAGFFVATDVGVIDAMTGPMEAGFAAGRGRREEWEAFTSELRAAFERGSGVWAFVMFVAWGSPPGRHLRAPECRRRQGVRPHLTAEAAGEVAWPFGRCRVRRRDE